MAHKYSKTRRNIGWRQRGSIAVLSALALVPLMLTMGGAIDFGRASIVRARLQTALDTAGLAVGSSDPLSANIEEVLSGYFYANYQDTHLGTVTGLSMEVNNDVISLAASAKVPTVFLKMIGQNEMSVAVSTEIIRETTGLEVVMVLDNTGSMARNGKLSALKNASHALVDSLFGEASNPALLKVGMVPFAGSVNVGASMDVSQFNTFDSFADSGQRTDWGRGEWGGCVEARPYPQDTLDTTADLGGNWDVFHWPDSCYTRSEPGCADTTHINVNSWWYQSSGTYVDDTSLPYRNGPNRDCSRPVTALTNNRAAIETEIDAMFADGYTHINFGAVWGWRVISPGMPYDQGVLYSDQDWKKAVIILTDGVNTTNSRVYTAYGYPSEGRLAGTTGGAASRDELDKRFTETCNNMKAEGIQVFTITFQLNDSNTQQIFRNCASEPEQYFDSPDNDSLQGAFRAIANQLSNLRVYR